ncbi:MAG TPA: glutamate--tRNA ligase [Candidatus Saccharimonadales bacterium]|nr:glutamate--tRNA ligase [Candidatus Saccharimonadales bacterium]
MKVRTRFAPSPTGYMHVGNLRTALFAWLTARHYDGQFILRLEDTDKNREVAGSAQHILACLDLLGLDRDEGLDVGGPYAPYQQSQRLDIYKRYAEQLIANGRAYADPYTSSEVQAFREQAHEAKKAFLYRHHRPADPPAWNGSQPLRFKSDPKDYAWHDEVMGDLKTGPEVIDDFILIKSDGYPTYNFAHIVDDFEMKVSHVIRGQEFIASVPNYLNLYEALDIKPPIMATMPHILAETGGKKLGKRDGAKDVLDYAREGYLPETLLSFIATLGWNDGSEQEVFSRHELIDKFDLSRVQRSGARFDMQRLNWMNGQFIRNLDLDELYKRAEDFWPDAAAKADRAYRRQVLGLVQDRLKTLADLPLASSYFFDEPTADIDMIKTNKQLKKLDEKEIEQLLSTAKDKLSGTNWTSDAVQTALNQLLDETGQKPGILFSLIRIAVTWAPFSPQLNDTLALLGQDRTLERLDSAINLYR